MGVKPSEEGDFLPVQHPAAWVLLGLWGHLSYFCCCHIIVCFLL